MTITQAQAHTIISAAHAHAREAGLRVTVAVVDEGGLLKGLDRMDGAPPLSSQIAEAKAQGAAVWHRDGHALAQLQSDRSAFFAAVNQMSRLPLIPGAGSLVIRDGHGVAIGAVGISGGTPDEDLACAEAGLAALNH